MDDDQLQEGVVVQQLATLGEIVQLAPLIQEMVKDPACDGVSARELCRAYVTMTAEGTGVVLALTLRDTGEYVGYLSAQFGEDLRGPFCMLGQLCSEHPGGGKLLIEELEELCRERDTWRMMGVVNAKRAEVMTRYYGARPLGIFLTKEISRGRNS